MKEPLNPLFPKSDGSGTRGAYEYAVLLDDEAETYKTPGDGDELVFEHPPKNTARKTKAATFRDFADTKRGIMQSYRESRRELRRQLISKEITSADYSRLRQSLAKDTDKALWENCFSYWNGTAKTRKKTAKRVVYKTEEPQRVKEKVNNLDALEF